MKTTPKSRRGGAYITVLTTTMVLLMITVVVLTITAVSRRVSAHYFYHAGLFDLAVAGNEQAFFLLRSHARAQNEAVSSLAWQQLMLMDGITVGFVYMDGHLHLDPSTREEHERIFTNLATSSLREALGGITEFTRVFFHYEMEWDMETIIDTGETIITDSISAITTLRPAKYQFGVYTRLHRYIGGSPGHPVFVDSVINWTAAGQREIILDAYTIEALEEAGAIFPFIPINGENLILILDDFALAMLESIRLVVPRSPVPS